MKNLENIRHELLEIASRLGELQHEIKDVQMGLGCALPTPEALKRYVITSHAEGSTLSNGDIITWVDNGTLTNPNDRVNVDINGVDQGVSTQAGQWTLQNLPSGPIEICLQEMIFDSNNQFVGLGPDRCCYNFVVEEEPAIDSLKDFVIPATPNDLGDVTIADLNAWTDGNIRFWGGEENSQIVVNNGVPCWRVYHVPNAQGSIRTGGACNIPRITEGCYTVSETITIDPNMDWGNGQIGIKVGAGLAGGQSSAGQLVSGGNSDTTGWSARPVIIADANGNPCFAAYLYYANRPGMPTTGTLFGDEIKTGVTAVQGGTYDIKHQVCLNDPGQANGTYNMMIDGVTVVNQSGILWMTGTPEIDVMFFSSFHGGNTTAWSPDMPVYVDYKNIAVTSP